MRGSCSYSVSCPQLTQRMCHSCSWAGNRKIGAPWSVGGGLMFLGSRSPTTASPPSARRGAQRAVPHRRLLSTSSGLPRSPDPVTVSQPGHGGADRRNRRMARCGTADGAWRCSNRSATAGGCSGRCAHWPDGTTRRPGGWARPRPHGSRWGAVAVEGAGRRRADRRHATGRVRRTAGAWAGEGRGRLDWPAAMKRIAEQPMTHMMHMTHVTHGTSDHGSALGLPKVLRQSGVLIAQTAVPFGHSLPGIRHRTTATVVVPDSVSANSSFTDRSTRLGRPTVPARTCTPMATHSGRSRWPNGPWTARSAARTRSSASTSSQPHAAAPDLRPARRPRNALAAPNEPRRGRLSLDLMEAHRAEGRDVHRVAPQRVPPLIGTAIGLAETVVEDLGPAGALYIVREQPVIVPRCLLYGVRRVR